MRARSNDASIQEKNIMLLSTFLKCKLINKPPSRSNRDLDRSGRAGFDFLLVLSAGILYFFLSIDLASMEDGEAVDQAERKGRSRSTAADVPRAQSRNYFK